ncbi:MAG: 2-C-methyl-D-erythritol 2,4-cyclodiphosphate synthase [Proteobacteria bacterium]|nr:2-C-methyl-D-erythritol 2,4-cyclodiphosphate synthase [Pseudomonadota bacterium]
MKVGLGYDVHRLVEGRKLILGGIEVPHDKGLLGHSDADVLLHAIMDALLGAAALGDIGDLFPDSDVRYKDADSLDLLGQVYSKVTRENLYLDNLDAVIMAEEPKLKPFMPKMIRSIAEGLQTDPERISVKATTTEKLGFVGREEGIAAQAVVLLRRR